MLYEGVKIIESGERVLCEGVKVAGAEEGWMLCEGVKIIESVERMFLRV